MVTVTSTRPGCAGAVNVSDVPLVTVTCPAWMLTPPMLTLVEPGTNPVPVTVTTVPPMSGPDPGVNPGTVGAAG